MSDSPYGVNICEQAESIQCSIIDTVQLGTVILCV